ncbi:MAG TPA: glycosyltransferase family 39 protein [Candidatus Sulfotelmatobacter sp.]|nr:glycosyltransferase family 39 protein [Candidatus Sulfotelmatobacter sp.]
MDFYLLLFLPHCHADRVNQRRFSEIFQAGQFTWLLLALVLAANFSIRWHLRSMPLERDEGEYAYAGQLLLQGVPPYEAAYNMKFPGTYFAYAVLMAVFGQTAEGIHLGIIVITSLSIVLMFFIGKNLLGDWGGLMAAAIFGAMSALPWAYGLAGHATHFVVLFVCAGSYALLLAEKKSSRAWLFVSGTAFGVAVLMKQHAAIFCIAGAAWVYWQNWKSKTPWFRSILLFSAGVALPLAVTAMVLAACGVWKQFEFWTIEYARQYVSLLTLRAAPQMFLTGFVPIFSDSVWTWIAGLGALALIFFNTGQRRAAMAGAGLFFAGLVAVCPGYFFRGHYFLMVMPGLALLVSTLLRALAVWLKKFPRLPQLQFLPACLFLVLIGEIYLRSGDEWLLSSPAELTRKIYFASPFPESTVVAAYIAAHSAPTDTVAVLGSEPQIFFLAHRRSATGYIYVYPLTEDQPLAGRMRGEFIREIETSRPKFVVYDNTLSAWCSTVTPGKTGPAMDEINHWWNGFAHNYETVGLVDIHDDAPTEFFWDQNIASRTNAGQANLYILRRNGSAGTKN